MKRLEVDKNRKYKIWVQKIDIKSLTELNVLVPSSVFFKFLIGEDFVNEKNQYDFIDFEREEEIQFFLSQDWILDYDQYQQFSTFELEIAKKIIFQDISNLEIELCQIPSEEIRKRNELKEKIQKRKKEYDSILYLLYMKTNNSKLDQKK